MTANSNWTRRNGSNYRRLCARPGCGAPAAATLRFQPTQREAWLVDLEDDGARTEGDLCARHAAGLVLPRGWQLHNSLTSARTETSEPARRRIARPGARPSPPAATRRRSRIQPDRVPALTGARVAVERGAAARPKLRVAPAEPAPLVAPATPEESEALAETLDAQTPLLRRAFSNVFLPESDT